METKRIDLYEYFGVKKPEGPNAEAILEYCLHSRSSFYPSRTHPAMIVCAGGGYYGICEREGEPVAAAYFGHGYQMFVMRYSCAPQKYPTQLIEGAMAVAYVRKNAAELQVDPDMIAIAGFSAGGHFVGMTATLTGEPEVRAALGEDADLAKPSAAIMGYPVISADYDTSHTIRVISGGDPELIKKVSLEKHVTADSAPAFIWSTFNDNLVHVRNAIEMACAYREAGAPVELHVYENGPHGLATATRPSAAPKGILDGCAIEEYVNPTVATWFEMSLTWLKNRGFTVKDL